MAAGQPPDDGRGTSDLTEARAEVPTARHQVPVGAPGARPGKGALAALGDRRLLQGRPVQPFSYRAKGLSAGGAPIMALSRAGGAIAALPQIRDHRLSDILGQLMPRLSAEVLDDAHTDSGPRDRRRVITPPGDRPTMRMANLNAGTTQAC